MLPIMSITQLYWQGRCWPLVELKLEQSLADIAEAVAIIKLNSNEPSDKKLLEILHAKQVKTLWLRLNSSSVIANPNPYESWLPVIIRQVKQMHGSSLPRCFVYELKLASRLSLLKDIHKERWWHHTDFQQVTTELAKLANFSSSQIEWRIIKSSPKVANLWQSCRLTVWQFWQWICAQMGWSYWFEKVGEAEKLIITDDVSGYSRFLGDNLQLLTNNSLRQFTQTYGFEAAKIIMRGIAEQCDVRGYHAEAAGQYFSAKQANGCYWENAEKRVQQYYYVMREALQSEIDQRAKQLATLSRQEQLLLMLHVPHTGLQIGQLIQPSEEFLQLHALEQYSAWLIIKIIHKVPKLETSENYYCEVICIPALQAYQLPLFTLPPLPLLQRMHIESDQNAACLSDDGQYRVRHYYEIQNHPVTQASDNLRRLSFYLSPGKESIGLHVPLHQQSEVLTACLSQDPSQVFIVGAFNTSLHPAIVTSQNAYQHVMLTASDQAFMMNDDPVNPHIFLRNQTHTNSILLDATPQQEQIVIHSEQGSQIQQAGNEINEHYGRDSIEYTAQNRQEISQQHCIVQINGEQYCHVKQNQYCMAQQNLSWSAHQDLMHEVSDCLEQRIQGDAQWLTTGARHKIVISQGKANLEVGEKIQIIGQCKQPILIQNNQAFIRIDPDGAIYIEGKDVLFEANAELVIEGKLDQFS